jgi:hypothetical protein
MFDNPKKELQWLEEQLLAAELGHEEEPDEEEELDGEEFDRLYDDIYDEFGREEPYEMDDELQSMLSRSAGYEEEYEMDEDRYVPAPKKRGFGRLVFFALMLPLAVIALVFWYFWRFL